MPVKSSEKIKLTVDDKILITTEKEVAMELNNFFSNAVINLKILKFENFEPLSENIEHPLKAIVKYRKHPAVITMV